MKPYDHRREISVAIVEGDALQLDVDVLSLKYAQEHHGVDELVSDLLASGGVERSAMRPRPGDHRLVAGGPGIAARAVLFVGVNELYDFGYREIRDFARRVLSISGRTAPHARHIGATLHGAGYGLDEFEAFEAEMAGFEDAIHGGEASRLLERISIVERDPGRALRLRPVLKDLYPALARPGSPGNENGRLERFRSAGHASDEKRHVFVAMPFDRPWDDTYHYGIQGAVRAAGFLCERADLSSFVGDAMQWIQHRIKTSSMVIAELTDANPNVYLEVGYAWASGVPVILLVRDVECLKFDVRGHRCLVYGSIRQLEELLRSELRNLDPLGGV